LGQMGYTTPEIRMPKSWQELTEAAIFSASRDCSPAGLIRFKSLQLPAETQPK
jgi:hypothetical protein